MNDPGETICKMEDVREPDLGYVCRRQYVRRIGGWVSGVKK